MTWIIILIILGLLLFVAELIIPGITVAAIGAFVCLVGAVTWAFVSMGTTSGIIVLSVTLLLLITLTALFFRPRTWNRFELKANIDSKAVPHEVEKTIEIGARGTTLTRLAPMGNVKIGGAIYEAKSLDSYIDPRKEVIVTGYDNNNIIVKSV